MLLVEMVRKVGLDGAISAALAPWRKPRAVHDPGKVLLDVALGVALGGDCLADVALLRAEPEVFGPVASDPTVSRLIDVLAAAGPKALAAIRSARAEVRSRVWELAGASSPAADGQVIVDIDGVLVLAHSEKQDATATWKKTFGHHPLVAFVDHGPAGSGEPVAALLRPGNAGSNTASDHITTTGLALAQLPRHLRRGRQTLIRTDSAGGTHAFLDWLTRPGRWLSYSVGMTITDALHQAVLKIPKKAWTPAYDADGTERPGAWGAEITDLPDLSTWPKGMRLVVRKERPHPGAQLRFTDLDGNRLTCFATNTKGGQLADLELRHRRRARCEDRIRNARDTGLRNLPLHDSAQNQIWLEIVSLALDLLAWMPMLALTGQTRRWEPNKLRLRLFSAAAQLVNTGRRHWLRFTTRWPWTDVITHAIDQLQAFGSRMGWVDHALTNQLTEPRYLRYLPPNFNPGENNQYRTVRSRQLKFASVDSGIEWLTVDQIARLVEATRHARDRFLVMLLWCTGMQIGEALGLRREDMHLLPDAQAFGCQEKGPHVHVRRRLNSNGAIAAGTLRQLSVDIDILPRAPPTAHAPPSILGARQAPQRE